MPRVVVIGAGLSGLAAGYRLRRAGIDVTVLEASSRAGGNIRTTTEEGFTWEAGPNGFLDTKPTTYELCRELGLGKKLIAASEASRKNRYLCRNGRLVKLPGSPQGLLTTRALSLCGKLSLLCEPFRRRGQGEESVHEFAVRRFGREAAETIVDALVTGIHAGDPKLLSLPAAFPRLTKFETESGSVFRGMRKASRERSGPSRTWSLTGGLQMMIDAMVAALGSRLKLNSPVRNLAHTNGRWLIQGDGIASWLADAVVVTVPAHVQASLLETLNPLLTRELKSIPYNPVVVVALGYRERDVPRRLDGFGYIAPQNTRRDVLGVQWCSSIFPGRAPEGCVLWRALCGGQHRADLLERTDDELLRVVQAEMQTVLHVTGEPVFARVQRWPRAIPQYVLGHSARVGRIEAMAGDIPGLFLGGNALHGVAMNDCTEQAVAMTARVSSYFLSGT